MFKVSRRAWHAVAIGGTIVVLFILAVLAERFGTYAYPFTLASDIARIGGKISHDEQRNIIDVELIGVRVSSRIYSRLMSYPGIRGLKFTRCDMTEASSIKTSGIRTDQLLQYEIINCTNCNLDWSWITTASSLTTLRVTKSLLNPSFHLNIDGSTSLRDINLTGTLANDITIRKLAKPLLMRLSLQNTSATDEGIRFLASHAKGLKELNLSDTQISSLDCLQAAQNLTQVGIDGLSLSAKDADSLLRLDRLVGLSMRRCKLQSGFSSKIAKHKTIGLLLCSDSEFDQHSIAELSNFRNLAFLDIRNTSFSNSSIEKLFEANHLSLRSISISGTEVTHLSEKSLMMMVKLSQMEACRLQLDEVTLARIRRILPRFQLSYASCSQIEIENDGKESQRRFAADILYFGNK
ncbi:MAG: hypothetical protein V4719_29205 [Planctomycetota bacterium]